MTLVTPGHTWSHLVTTGDMKFVIHLTLALLAHSQLGQLPLNDAGHSWSHLVTTGHKLFLGHCWSHWSHPSHLIPLWVREISLNGMTHRRTGRTLCIDYLAVAEPGPEAIVLGHRVVMPTDLDFRLQAEMAAGRWRFPAATEN